MRITYEVHDGLDTRWKRIGDYEFTADIEPRRADYSYSYRWSMTPPADSTGVRSVAPDDLAHSHKVSLFYTDGQNCCLIGYMDILRISNDLFRHLKRDQKTDFELDGPEVMQTYHKESVPMPHTIEPVGTEFVNVIVNNQPAKVRAIKTETNNHWHYWVMDNPNFPIIVQADGPFRWDPPSFSNAGFADKEGKRIIDDLKLHGIATSHLILFDFDSDKLRPESKKILNTVGKYLKDNPAVKIEVQGHCDIMGGYQYNMNLSKSAGKFSTKLPDAELRN